MAVVDFKDVPEGTIFTHNSVEYQKIAPIKVNCCTTLNAVTTNEVKSKVMIRPLEKVTVNE